MITHVLSKNLPRVERRDLVIAAFVSALALLLMIGSVADPPDPTNPEEASWVQVAPLLPLGLAIPLILLITTPLAWRRVAPVAAVVASLAGLVLNFGLVGTEFLRCGVVGVTAMLIAFGGGALSDRRGSRLALGGTIALVLVDFIVEFGPGPEVAVVMALTFGAWGLGRVARSRRTLNEQLADHTRMLRDARDERARLEVGAERARVAAELDMLLQRRIGDLGAMAEAGAGSPDTVAVLAQIEHESRATLAEMRALVGVLRDPADPTPRAPQPTLAQVESVLARVDGPAPRLQVQGSPRVLPPTVELSALRVLEQLVDAIEGDPRLEVRITFDDDSLELELSGTMRRRAAPALERARERVRLHHGSMDTEVRRGHACARVLLPLHAGS
jgi:hypothetical protein